MKFEIDSEKICDELNDILREYVYAVQDGRDEYAKELLKEYNVCSLYTQAITGKVPYVHNYCVTFGRD